MDQVLLILEQSLVPDLPEPPAEPPRRSKQGERPITASMINNYVKQGLIEPPRKKRYTRQQVASLLLICLLKNLLPIADIKLLLQTAENQGFAVFYDSFCSQLETRLNSLKAEAPADQPDLPLAAAQALAQKFYLQKRLQNPTPSDIITRHDFFAMQELSLKYGCNPNQQPARIYAEGELPITILNGSPGYINLLDAFNSWQLVRELKEACGLPAAASFKHVSPAGAAVAVPLDETLRQIYFVEGVELSPIATAYVRARGADRMSSYGDFAALSDECDEATARFLLREVSDGIIAPGYTPAALEILRQKRKGSYLVIQIDPDYQPQPLETKQVFGISFEQLRNDVQIDASLLQNRPTQNQSIPEEAVRDLLIALITLKYTQSNSVCYAKGGQAIGIGAGQQSRIHCTRLAGNKADIWFLRQHPKVLALPFKADIRRPDRDNTIDVYISEEWEDVLAEGVWQQFFTSRPEPLSAAEKREWLTQLQGVALGSDAFFPFGDNIERAHKSGVQYIAQTGGSVRDDHVIATCDKYGIAMAFTGVRLFHH